MIFFSLTLRLSIIRNYSSRIRKHFDGIFVFAFFFVFFFWKPCRHLQHSWTIFSPEEKREWRRVRENENMQIWLLSVACWKLFRVFCNSGKCFFICSSGQLEGLSIIFVIFTTEKYRQWICWILRWVGMD